MAGDSQATFSQSVKAKIRETYHRCVICLTLVRTSRCAHIIDAATAGKQQLLNAVGFGVLPDDYERNAETNGMVQCPSCHSYFTANHIVLSLPIPILQYLEKYVSHTPKADRKPLREVFDLLVDASQGVEVELPNVKAIFPYLGLFTMVVINPTQVTGYSIPTPHLPILSIIRGSKFVEAPSNASPTAEKAARIFQSKAIDNNTPLSFGMIPLSLEHQAFIETCYWRLPVSAAAIFAALIERLAYDSSDCEAIMLAKNIRDILSLQSRNAYPPDGHARGNSPSDGSGPSGVSGPSGGDGPGGGGWPSGGGSKRKYTCVKSSSSSSHGNKKARKVSGGGDGIGDRGEPSGGSARSQNGQSHHREITSSSCRPEDEVPVPLIDAGWNDSDSESGRSVSAISPHDEDNPDKWRFGPSFSTNKIVFTARAVNLT